MRALMFALAGALAFAAPVGAEDSKSIFILRTTAKSPDAVVEAVRAYSERQQWRYIGDSKVKQGEVTLVKICIPEVGRAVWPAGLELSALLPCGNLGVYRSGPETEISVLHPRYMAVLHPDPATESAGEIALPLLLEMLDAVTR